MAVSKPFPPQRHQTHRSTRVEVALWTTVVMPWQAQAASGQKLFARRIKQGDAADDVRLASMRSTALS